MKLSAVQLKSTVVFFTIAVLAASGFGIFKRQEAQNLCVAPRAWADQLQSFKSRLSLIESEGGFGGAGFKNMLKSGALLYFKVRSAEEFKEDLQTMAKPFALQIGSVTLTDAALPQIDPEIKVQWDGTLSAFEILKINPNEVFKLFKWQVEVLDVALSPAMGQPFADKLQKWTEAGLKSGGILLFKSEIVSQEGKVKALVTIEAPMMLGMRLPHRQFLPLSDIQQKELDEAANGMKNNSFLPSFLTYNNCAAKALNRGNALQSEFSARSAVILAALENSDRAHWLSVADQESRAWAASLAQ